MKYNTLKSVEQEIGFKPSIENFGGILGAGVRTSVVHFPLNKMPIPADIVRPECGFLWISQDVRRISNQSAGDSYKACIK